MDEHFVLTPWKGGSCQPPKVKNDPTMLTEILFDSLEILEISRFAALSKAFWLRMVSMAIAVLPVCRSPMISSRCPRPMGIRLSTAFKPVVLTVSQWLLFEVNLWGLLGKKMWERAIKVWIWPKLWNLNDGEKDAAIYTGLPLLFYKIRFRTRWSTYLQTLHLSPRQWKMKCSFLPTSVLMVRYIKYWETSL